jgi:GT2 family glycosyltransferase
LFEFGLARLVAFFFVLPIHLDAIRLSPRAYASAARWWLLRKRVRARGQFAPLLGQSPRAYELWALRQERLAPPVRAAQGQPIIALVAAGTDAAALRTSLASLDAAGVAACVIAEPTDRALRQLLGEVDFNSPRWVMPVRAGDRVAKDAATAYGDMIARCNPACHVIYADDDQLDRWGHRGAPYFKPDWNSELHQHHDIVTDASIIRADAAMLGDVADHADWQARLVAAAVQRGPIAHIPAVLHHRASRIAPAAKLPPVRIASALPLVSVIIPTRNRADLLRTCIAGLRATQYPAIEIIIADNDSKEPETRDYLAQLAREGVVVLPQPGPFNYSTINNNAVAIAKGALICLMNNDVEILAPDWLAIMATQAMRPEVGAVGAQLLYPDGRIQHAGVVIGVGNAAGHAHRFVDPAAEGYFRRHALPQYVSAVTAACLVVQKERFLAVGGLDAANFAVAFNDVDLCLRLNQRGWQSFYEPRSVLVHHESISRGFDTDPVGAARFAGELAALQRIWRTNAITDPFHHPNLSRASEQFALSLMA